MRRRSRPVRMKAPCAALDDDGLTHKAQASSVTLATSPGPFDTGMWTRGANISDFLRLPVLVACLSPLSREAAPHMISSRTAGLFAAVASTAFLGASPATKVPPPESMFRGGPSHHGVYHGGGPTLLGLAWRAPTDGDVVSSPAVAGGVVYIGSGDGALYALDLYTGARRWRYDAGSPVSSSPAVGGGLVFATARDGSIFAVDAATGG